MWEYFEKSKAKDSSEWECDAYTVCSVYVQNFTVTFKCNE